MARVRRVDEEGILLVFGLINYDYFSFSLYMNIYKTRDPDGGNIRIVSSVPKKANEIKPSKETTW